MNSYNKEWVSTSARIGCSGGKTGDSNCFLSNMSSITIVTKMPDIETTHFGFSITLKRTVRLVEVSELAFVSTARGVTVLLL